MGRWCGWVWRGKDEMNEAREIKERRRNDEEEEG
jgi:hypothetical protein